MIYPTYQQRMSSGSYVIIPLALNLIITMLEFDENVLWSTLKPSLSRPLLSVPQKAQMIFPNWNLWPWALTQHIHRKLHLQITNGISEIVSLYDAFILDQHGVLHNGKSAFSGAVDCVKELHAAMGKKLIILSNTSSPSASTFDRLPTLGFDKSNF